MPDAPEPVLLDLWADIVCPWCYVGRVALERAISEEGLEGRVHRTLHSFELDPDAPVAGPDGGAGLPTNTEYLREKVGLSPEQIAEGEDRQRALADSLGVPYVDVRPSGSTRSLHRFLQAVQATVGHGAAAAFFATLQDGYFSGTLDIFDPVVLAEQARAVGLPAGDAALLAAEPTSPVGEKAENVVSHDIATARQIGVRGVPYLVVDRQFAAPGAQDVAAYRQLLRRFAD
ncbi:DsbA family oxidoreductase [uncultured Kocuria sp.]|uniref:DsbA family oxidoreductase n=1 Tax=uncultured Kocuria sp. TaxID=259305 RepID=UPI0025EA2279|nr:DsbA family oxidoreductase [uncultured Kocuria sp.]